MSDETVIAKANQFQTIANDILEQAKRLGASQAELNISANKGFTISAHGGDVETVEYHQDKAIEINVMFGKRSGASSISDIRPEAVKAAVEAACHIAKYTDEDEAAGLAGPDELAFNYQKLELAYDWPVTVEKAIELACQCERETLAADKRIMSVEDASVATMQALHVYANSNGFMGLYPYTRHEMSCTAVSKQGEEMQRDHAYTVATHPDDLLSVSLLAKQAAEKAVGRLNARQIKTMKTPVIFAAEQARGLIGHFINAITGGSLYRHASFLYDHLNKKIFPDFMHLQEKPWLSKALGSVAFDGDGVATRENVFVEDGILRQYVLGIYAARKLGMKTTGNAGGVHNLVVKTGNKDLPALLKTMNKGLLITEMMGSGVNLLTGDYSRGVSGFWVENGEIQFPVEEITVAGHLQDMFMRIKEIGNDVDLRGNVRTGSILIEEMTVAGSSE